MNVEHARIQGVLLEPFQVLDHPQQSVPDRRRGSLFLAVQLECDIDEQVRRIDNPDRIALRKGADPPGYRWHRQNVKMFQPPPEDRFDIDTTDTSPEDNAELIRGELVRRGFVPTSP